VVISKLFPALITDSTSDFNWIENKETVEILERLGRDCLENSANIRKQILERVPVNIIRLRSILSSCLQLSKTKRMSFWQLVAEIVSIQKETGHMTSRDINQWTISNCTTTTTSTTTPPLTTAQATSPTTHKSRKSESRVQAWKGDRLDCVRVLNVVDPAGNKDSGVLKS